MSIRLSAVALVAAAFVPLSAHAADDSELRGIRAELDQLKATYEGRIQALEAQLQTLQQRLDAKPSTGGATSTPATASARTEEVVPGRQAAVGAPPLERTPEAVAASAVVPDPRTPAGPGGAQSAASGFNPAISLILNGNYANLSRDPSLYRLQGFIPSGGEVGPGARSFSLGESELSLSASIDPTFSGRLTASITAEDRIEVEEALFERQGLFDGATLRGGRFLSSIGYLNSQHAHAWDFFDAPLVYQAFFGGRCRPTAFS